MAMFGVFVKAECHRFTDTEHTSGSTIAGLDESNFLETLCINTLEGSLLRVVHALNHMLGNFAIPRSILPQTNSKRFVNYYSNNFVVPV